MDLPWAFPVRLVSRMGFFSMKFLRRAPSVSEERDWERENVRIKTERYLRTNPMDCFASDEPWRLKVLAIEEALAGIQGLVLDIGGNTAGEATILCQRGL